MSLKSVSFFLFFLAGPQLGLAEPKSNQQAAPDVNATPATATKRSLTHGVVKLNHHLVKGGTPTFENFESRTPWYAGAGAEVGFRWLNFYYDLVGYKVPKRIKVDRWRLLLQGNVLDRLKIVDLWLRTGAEAGFPTDRIQGFNFNMMRWIYDVELGGGVHFLKAAFSYRIMDPLDNVEQRVDEQAYRFDLRAYDRTSFRLRSKLMDGIFQPEATYGVYRFSKSFFRTPLNTFEFTHPTFHYLNAGVGIKPPLGAIKVTVGFNQIFGPIDRYRLYLNTGTRTLDFGHSTYFIQMEFGIDANG